jgi:NAD(P)-dependent dehydrogenase (short-subunit alcohol dehydrogenase family)
MGGLTTFPGLAAYHGSKYAMEGIAETVGKEVAAFGVRVTAVEPGGFRTDWAGRSMVRTPRSIADYDELFEPMRARRQAGSGNQLGDPALAAQAILQVIAAPNPRLIWCWDPTRCVWPRPGGRRSTPTSRAGRRCPGPTDFPDGAQIR